MKTPLILLVLALCLLAGCNYGSMVVDSESGRTIYSKYYDAGDWIIPHRLGVSVVIDHEKSEFPVVHGIQQSIGALGPGDLEAQGKVTVYLWSRDPNSHHVRITRISSGASSITPNKEFVALKGQRAGGEVGHIPISNYGTKVPLTVEFEIDGSLRELTLNLERRTYDELKKFFGPKGVPPYPWYHDAEKKG